MGKAERVGVAGLTAIVGVVAVAAPADAHDFGSCGNAFEPRWTSSTGTYRIDVNHFAAGSTWEQAINAGHTNATNGTAFDWSQNQFSSVVWRNSNDPNTNVSGSNLLTWTNSPCVITSALPFLNVNHFTAAAHQNQFNSVDHKTCSAIHESGHAIGLNHDPLGFDQSIMQAESHNDRCNKSTPMVNFQPHNVFDIGEAY